ncbi:unnamed protein product, partial [Amoebophrya sp. A120]|eukprot:GSA120T00017700001.1
MLLSQTRRPRTAPAVTRTKMASTRSIMLCRFKIKNKGAEAGTEHEARLSSCSHHQRGTAAGPSSWLFRSRTKTRRRGCKRWKQMQESVFLGSRKMLWTSRGGPPNALLVHQGGTTRTRTTLAALLSLFFCLQLLTFIASSSSAV